jgi:hypothetical protein
MNDTPAPTKGPTIIVRDSLYEGRSPAPTSTFTLPQGLPALLDVLDRMSAAAAEDGKLPNAIVAAHLQAIRKALASMVKEIERLNAELAEFESESHSDYQELEAESGRINKENSSLRALIAELCEELTSMCRRFKNAIMANGTGEDFANIAIARACALLDKAKASAGDRSADEEGEGGNPATPELLKPHGNNGIVSADICFDALLLIDLRHSPGVMEVAQIAAWTQDERDRVYDWAMRVHLSAGDNDDVFVPQRPAILGGDTSLETEGK